MTEERPLVFVLAGPNGAGKTTAAPYLVRDAMGIEEFVNADVIAQGLSGFNPQRVDFAAGRIMLARLKELARKRVSFAFETTLASRSFAPWLRELRREGYRVELHFVWLPTVELSIQRVASRVAKGGHHVPSETVARRYARGLRNLIHLYRDLADHWQVYDNAGNMPRPVALSEYQETKVLDEATWATILQQAADP